MARASRCGKKAPVFRQLDTKDSSPHVRSNVVWSCAHKRQGIRSRDDFGDVKANNKHDRPSKLVNCRGATRHKRQQVQWLMTTAIC
jgi:hypothetical protein